MLIKSLIIRYISKLTSKDSQMFWANRDKTFAGGEWEESYFNDRSEARRALHSILNNLKLKNIFEFGCNSGPNAFYLSKQSLESYVGIDVNIRALELAKLKLLDKRFDFFDATKIETNKDFKYENFETFISLYSLSYLNEEECTSLLGKFIKCNVFLIAEPQNSRGYSLILNRIPEFSHNYVKILDTAFTDSFLHLKMNLDNHQQNLKSISLFIRN